MDPIPWNEIENSRTFQLLAPEERQRVRAAYAVDVHRAARERFGDGYKPSALTDAMRERFDKGERSIERRARGVEFAGSVVGSGLPGGLIGGQMRAELSQAMRQQGVDRRSPERRAEEEAMAGLNLTPEERRQVGRTATFAESAYDIFGETATRNTEAEREPTAEELAGGEVKLRERVRRMDKGKLLPFHRIGLAGMRGLVLLEALDRADRPEEQTDEHKEVLDEYYRMIEDRARGQSIPAAVAEVSLMMPAYMIEMAATGPLVPGGSILQGLMRQGGTKAVSKWVAAKTLAGKAAQTVGKAAARGGVRAAILPGGTIDEMAQRQARWLQVDEAGNRVLLPKQETVLESALKAYGSQTIEYASEEIFALAGEAGVGKAAAKLLPKRGRAWVRANKRAILGKVFDKWKAIKPDGKTGEFIDWFFRESARGNPLEEWGEERVGDLARAITGIEDFGAENPRNVLERVLGAVRSGLDPEQMLIEGTAFTLGSPQAAITAVGVPMKAAQMAKQSFDQTSYGKRRAIAKLIDEMPDGGLPPATPQTAPPFAQGAGPVRMRGGELTRTGALSMALYDAGNDLLHVRPVEQVPGRTATADGRLAETTGELGRRSREVSGIHAEAIEAGIRNLAAEAGGQLESIADLMALADLAEGKAAANTVDDEYTTRYWRLVAQEIRKDAAEWEVEGEIDRQQEERTHAQAAKQAGRLLAEDRMIEVAQAVESRTLTPEALAGLDVRTLRDLHTLVGLPLPKLPTRTRLTESLLTAGREIPPAAASSREEEAPVEGEPQPVREPAAVAPPGTKAVATRMVNAEEAFLDAVQEQFGKTREEAIRVRDRFRKDKLVKFDPVTGQYSLAHGAAWEQDVIDRAAAAPPAAPATPEPVEAAQRDALNDLRARYKPGNPFSERAARARDKATRLSAQTEREQAMANAFPLGVGGSGPRPQNTDRQIDASVARAKEFVQAIKDAEFYKGQAESFDAGTINAQGKRITKESQERSAKLKAQVASRKERQDQAQQEKEGKEDWQVSRDTYAAAAGYFGGSGRDLILAEHRESVEAALAAGKPVPAEVLADYPDLAPAKPVAASQPAAVPVKETVDTISGRMDMAQFERMGYQPEEVTRQNWIDMQRAWRRRLNQPEGGDNPRAPWAEYEEFHRNAVERAIARGDDIDDRVLADYPDLAPKVEAPPAAQVPAEPAAETAPEPAARPAEAAAQEQQPAKQEAETLPAPAAPSEPAISLWDETTAFLKRAMTEPVRAADATALAKRMLDEQPRMVAEVRAKIDVHPEAKRKRADTKDKMAVATVRRRFEQLAHLLTDAFVFSPTQESMESAAVRIIAEATDADFKRRFDEMQAKREDRKQAIEDPQTLDQFHTFIAAKGDSAMSPEQRARYEALVAEQEMARREQMANARKQTVGQVAGVADTTMDIVERFHDRRGHNVFIVTMGDRVGEDTFRELAQKARQLGGNWSKAWRPTNSPAGFMFNDRESAEKFMALRDGSVTKGDDDQPAKDEARDATAKRLIDMADKMEETAKAALEAPRLVNTPKRAREAGYAEQSARESIALAKTIRNIATAIGDGRAKFLRGLRTRKQVEQLRSILETTRKRLSREEAMAKGVRDSTSSEAYGNVNPGEAEFPAVTMYNEDIIRTAIKLESIKGGKLIAKRLRALAVGDENADQAIRREMAESIVKLLGKDAPWHVPEVLARIKRLEAMGITNQPELRSALREYMTYAGEAPPERLADKLRREMVGETVGIDYFPTPPALAAHVVALANIEPGMSVLEPSAGDGRIAKAVEQAVPDADLSVIEMSGTLRAILSAEGYELAGSDFMDYTGPQVDRVVMNPPFSNNADIKHVRHAYEMLKPGGRLVAIMSEHAFFASEKEARDFRDWLDGLGGISTKNPDGSFMDRTAGGPTTGVSTRTVVIDKSTDAVPESAPAAPAATKIPYTGDTFRDAQSMAETSMQLLRARGGFGRLYAYYKQGALAIAWDESGDPEGYILAWPENIPVNLGRQDLTKWVESRLRRTPYLASAQVGTSLQAAAQPETPAAPAVPADDPMLEFAPRWFPADPQQASDALSRITQNIEDLRKQLVQAETEAAKYASEHALLHQKGRFDKGKLKSSAPKAKKAEYLRLQRVASDLDEAILMQTQTMERPASIVARRALSWRLLNDRTAPMLSRLAARLELEDMEEDRRNSRLSDEIDGRLLEESRKMARSLYADASDTDIANMAPAVGAMARWEARYGNPLTEEKIRHEARYRQEFNLTEIRKGRVRHAMDAAVKAAGLSEGMLAKDFMDEVARFKGAKEVTAEEADAILARLPEVIARAVAERDAKQKSAQDKADAESRAVMAFRDSQLAIRQASEDFTRTWTPPYRGATPPAALLANVLRANRRSPMPILSMVAVRNGQALVSDLQTEVAVPVPLPDGMYVPAGPDPILVPDGPPSMLAEFPFAAEWTADRSLAITDGPTFLAAVRAAGKFIGDDPGRLPLSHVWLRRDGDRMLLHASNGFRIVVFPAWQADASAMPPDMALPLAPETVKILKEFKHAPSLTIEIRDAKAPDGKSPEYRAMMRIVTPDAVITSAVPDMTPYSIPPDVMTAIPERNVTVDRKAFAKAMDALKKRSGKDWDKSVTVTDGDGAVTLEITGLQGKRFAQTVPARIEAGSRPTGGVVAFTFQNSRVGAVGYDSLEAMVAAGSTKELTFGRAALGTDPKKDNAPVFGMLAAADIDEMTKAPDTAWKQDPWKPKNIRTKPGETDDVLRSMLDTKSPIPVAGMIRVQNGMATATSDFRTAVVAKTTLKDGLYLPAGKDWEKSTADHEYPDISPIKGAPVVKLNAEQTKSFHRALLFANPVRAEAQRDSDQRLTVLAGVAVDKRGGLLTVAGTDGRRMHSAPIAIDEAGEDFDIVIPKEAVRVLMTSGGNGPLAIRKDNDDRIQIDDGNVTIIAKEEGKFPSFRQVRPERQHMPFVVMVNRRALGQAASEVAAWAMSDPNLPKDAGAVIKLDIRNDGIRVFHTQGEVAYHKEATVLSEAKKWSTGKGAVDRAEGVSLNAQFLNDSLEASDSEFLYIGMTDAFSPMVVDDVDDARQSTMMPMRARIATPAIGAAEPRSVEDRLADVRAAMPWAKVEVDGDTVRADLPNGETVHVEFPNVIPSPAWATRGQIPLGAWFSAQQVMALADRADRETIDHEVWHMAKSLANLSKAQLAVLNRRFGGDEEAEAEAYAKWSGRGDTLLDRVFAAVRRFFARLADALGLPTAGGAFEGVRTGTAFGAARGAEAEGAEARYMMAGEKARTAGNTARAEAMERDGRSREDIWRETGWYRGVDGRWRFEVDDSKLKVKNAWAQTLGGAVSAPEVFAAYPGLRRVPFAFHLDETAGKARGSFSDRGGAMGDAGIDIIGTFEEIPRILVHEIQHAIQKREGFAMGGSPADFSLGAATDVLKESNRLYDALNSDAARELEKAGKDWKQIASIRRARQGEYQAVIDALNRLGESDIAKARSKALDIGRDADPSKQYRRLAGEAESRLVARRLDMTAEQRKAEPPWVTMETMLREEGLLPEGQRPEDVLIVRRGGGTAAMESSPAVTPAQDREYLAAVERGDMDAAQAMVDQAAQAAGYTMGPVWHGSHNQFTVFKGDEGFHFGTEQAAYDAMQQKGPISIDYEIEKVGGEWWVFADNGPQQGEGIGPYDSKADAKAAIVKMPKEIDGPRRFFLRVNNPRRVSDVGTGLGWRQEIARAKRQKRGYDALEYTNEQEDRGSTSVVVWNPSQIKLADTVTRDDSGRVIPLSERFSKASPDIRYRLPAGGPQADIGLAEKVLNKLSRGPLRDVNDRPELSTWRRFLTTIHHYADRVPGLKRMYEAAVNFATRKHELGEDLFGAHEGDLAILRRFARRKNRRNWKAVEDYLWQQDNMAQGPSVLEDGDLYIVRDAAGKDIDIVDDREQAWEMAHELERQELLAKGRSQESADIVRLVREINDRGWRMLAANVDRARAEAEAAGVELPQVVLGDGRAIDLWMALAEMGSRRGYYMPRLHEQGQYELYATKVGAPTIRRAFTTKAERRLAAGQYRRDGYSVEALLNTTPSEEVFLDASPVAVMDMVNNALERMARTNTARLADFDLQVRTEDYTKADGTTEPHLVVRSARRYSKPFREVAKLYAGYPDKGTGEWRFPNPSPDIESKLASSMWTMTGGMGVPQEMFARALAGSLARVIESRGSRARRIGRSGKVGADVVQGFETDALRAITRAGRATAGGTAKSEMAKAMLKAMTGTTESWAEFRARMADDERFDGMENSVERNQAMWEAYQDQVARERIDSARQPNAYADAKSYMQDMLRNDTNAERVAGTLRGVAAVWHLSGLAPAAVNVTAQVTSVPAVMHEAGVSAFRIPGALISAGKDYTAWALTTRFGGTYTGADADVLDEIGRRGWDDALMNKEALDILTSGPARAWGRIAEWMLFPFGVTERLNRGSTILASYREMRRKGMEHEEALTRAKKVSDDAHGVYGKVNLPALARGGTAPANMARMWYMYKTFTHNYLTVMGRLGVTDKRAAAWMLVSPMVIGGYAGLPGKEFGAFAVNVLLQALGIEPPDDPEQWVYDMAEELFGPVGDAISRTGLVGLLGVDIRGSLEMRLDEFLPARTVDLLGAPASLFIDAAKAARYAIEGEGLRAVEMLAPRIARGPIRAVRESQDGIVDAGGTPIYWGDEQVQATVGESWLRAAGFSPARLSEIRRQQWRERVVRRSYDDARRDIYRAYRNDMRRLGAMSPDLQAAIAEYNEKAQRAEIPGVTLVKDSTLRGIKTRMGKPNRFEAERAADEQPQGMQVRRIREPMKPMQPRKIRQPGS